MAEVGKVQGIPETTHALDQVADGMADLTKVNRAIASAALPAARSAAPRRTGRGAASLEASGTATQAILGTSLVYMAVQEFGSPRHNIEGLHYAGQAMDQAEADAEKAYTDEAKRLTQGAGLQWR
jgi:phage gpG-like protein